MASLESELRLIIQHEIRKALEAKADDRRRVESVEHSQPVTHDHVPVSQNVSPSGGGEPGVDRGLGLDDGSRDVHPGGGRGEHRGLDLHPYVQKIDVKDPEEKDYARLHLGGAWADAGEDPPLDRVATFEVAFHIKAPVDVWAALVLEHEYEGFSTGPRGRAAESLYRLITMRLDGTGFDWRNVWPRK